MLLSQEKGKHKIAGAKEITDAGSTFPYPIYAKWAEAYEKNNKTKLNYQPIGSGGGIKQIEAGTVDFGASDKPLKAEDITKNNLIQFPAIIGGIVAIVNLSVDRKPVKLTLNGQVMGDIFSGVITKWNDPKISELNSNIRLPDQPIIVVHRSDGSGTTFVLSHYLFQVSDSWKHLQGKDASPDSTAQWATGAIGGQGNEGVAAQIQQVPNTIGYVEYAFSAEHNLNHTTLKNQVGQIVEPTIESFTAAAANAKWESEPNFHMILTNQPGEKSWPITGASFILLKNEGEHNNEVCAFFDWAFKNGAELASGLHYIPLPKKLVTLIEKTWKDHKIEVPSKG